jgi:hypothetical protein
VLTTETDAELQCGVLRVLLFEAFQDMPTGNQQFLFANADQTETATALNIALRYGVG